MKKTRTFQITQIYNDYLSARVEQGYFSSKSEMVREILNKFLEAESENLKIMRNYLNVEKSKARAKITTFNLDVSTIEVLDDLKPLFINGGSELLRIAIRDYIFEELTMIENAKRVTESEILGTITKTYTINNKVKEFKELNLEAL